MLFFVSVEREGGLGKSWANEAKRQTAATIPASEIRSTPPACTLHTFFLFLFAYPPLSLFLSDSILRTPRKEPATRLDW